MKIPTLKQLTNRQLEGSLLALMILVFVASFAEALGRSLLLLTILFAPIAIGFTGAIVFHHIDQRVEYNAFFGPQAHMRLAGVLALLVGSIVKHLGTQIPLIPYNPTINAILLVIAPKSLFFLCGIALTLLGYYLGWRETADER